MRTLHKDRNLRYADALELKDDLEDWLENQEEADYPARKGRYFYNSFGNTFSEDEEQEEEMKKRLKLKKVLPYAVAFVAILFLFWGGYALLKSFLIVPEVTVPDLANLSYEEAENKLSEVDLV